MKTVLKIAASFAVCGFLQAEEPAEEIAGLQKAALEFVTAYNEKDAEALSLLFTKDGEMTTLKGEGLTSGREAIKARYERHFAGGGIPNLSIEVDSVRLVAPGLAIEDGTAHFTPDGDLNEPPRSVTYTAVLHQDGEGNWKIASSRSLQDVSDAAANLADLAKDLNGEWTCFNDQGVRLDLAFGWDQSGKFLSGDLLVSAADSEPQKGRIRIGWNAARKSIVSWMFDAEGGVTQGVWTAVEDGWVVRSEGTTSDGESLTANQKITKDGNDTMVWNISNRMLDGDQIPDSNLRFVRPAPTPASE